MHPMLNIAIRAARGAGNVIVRSLDRLDRVDVAEKSQNDYVTEVDRQAEHEIIRTIQKAYPAHAILAEESGAQTGRRGGNDEYRWVIDPLDGTTNYLHGFPQFAVSIALEYRGQLEQAVVYDPLKNELFTASRGGGAQLNGRRIRVTNRRNLHGALLGTGIPFREEQDLDSYLDTLKALIPGTAGVRRAGSAALDLAYVAAGRLDGFWEFQLNRWDMAAGVLLVLEAGGMVGDMTGGPDHLESGNIVCGGPKVYQAMLERLRETR